MSIPEASDIQGDLPAAATRQGMVDRKELSAFAFQRFAHVLQGFHYLSCHSDLAYVDS